jgi:uncharacterized protein YgbK (DUF1537 family)
MLPVAAIADDLTGAAEVAAVGFRYGLRSAVSTDFSSRGEDLGCLVLDTDSRLLPVALARSRVQDASVQLARLAPELVFKKIDSVLRGNVLAEVGALASAFGRPRVLLLPANPSLGRVIRNGRYFINGIPLHETAFAADPHHPARSNQVHDLLRAEPAMPVVRARVGEELPSSGVIVAEAANADEVASWAARVDPSMLVAGGSEFFAALLQNRKFSLAIVAPPCVPESPVLVVSGSLAPASRAFSERADRLGWLVPLPSHLAKRQGTDPSLFEWPDPVRATLLRHRVAVISAAHLTGVDPEQIRWAFATAVQQLRSQQAFHHLVIEGGATSASILNALQWPALEVVREWAPGVISLRPSADPRFTCTLKSGSYAWPESLLNHLTGQLITPPSGPNAVPRRARSPFAEIYSRPP